MIRLIKAWWRNFRMPSRRAGNLAILDIYDLQSDIDQMLRPYRTKSWREQMDRIWVEGSARQ